MRNRQPMMARSSAVEISIRGILECYRSTNLIRSYRVNCMRHLLLILSILILAVQSFSQSHAEQVKTIQDDPRVKAAFEHIDKDRDYILREWIAITEINAPSKQEQERAKFIESLLRKHKLDIRYDSAVNLIATRKGSGSGPVAVFYAQMETVFQPVLSLKDTI